MVNRKYIADKVFFYLKKEGKFFTSSDVHNMIGLDIFPVLAAELGYPKSNYSCVLVSGVWKVNVSSDFIKLDDSKDIIFSDGSFHKIEFKSQKNIGRDSILSATAGIPSHYFMEDEDTIGVYPPSCSGVIDIPYVKRPTSLSSDTDTNQLTEKCYMAAVYWVVAQCMLMDNDTRYQVYEMKYDKELQRLRGDYADIFDESATVVPHKDYLR